MSASDSARNVLRDLIADRATQGLSASEREQLEQLTQGGVPDAEELELAAAAIQLAEIMPNEPLPAKLKEKVRAQARTFFRRDRQSAIPVRPALSWVRWAGWAFAALILLAVGIRDFPGARRFRTSSEMREALLSEPGTVRWVWSATGDAAAKGLTGDVVWNEREQRGYMTFHNLASNNPNVSTYQLWVFAENQDERFPVDGGVFDIPAGGVDVVVPITPRIHVAGAKLFAVTVERPGGVVVSKRERIVSVAKLS